MKVIVLTILALTLSGCAGALTAPSYVVILTGDSVTDNQRCTGALLDGYHVLTAGHCAGVERVVTQDGQEAGVKPDVFIRQYDVAVLTLSRPLVVGEHALIGVLDVDAPAQVYGGCPFVDLDVARRLTFVEANAEGEPFDHWHVPLTFGRVDYVCGGDSGAPVLQGGYVVGVLSAVETSVPLVVQGAEVYAVPIAQIELALELAEVK